MSGEALGASGGLWESEGRLWESPRSGLLASVSPSSTAKDQEPSTSAPRAHNEHPKDMLESFGSVYESFG